MSNASMQLCTKLIHGDTVEFWDNELDKPALVLIHGFGATTRFQWFKQVEMLSEKYRVILPNLLHFGNSFPSKEKYKVADQVNLVKNLVDELKLDTFILGGISYGGLVSIEFAKNYPEKVEKLMIFDAPIKFMFASDIEDVCKNFKVASVEDLFVPENAKGLKRLWYLSSSKRSFAPPFLFKEFYKRMYIGNKSDKRKLMKTLLSEIDKYAKHEYNLKMPMLLIWGSNDMVIPAERGKMLYDYLGENAEFHVIFKGGHMVNLNKTKEFNEILGGWLF
ncbi:MAG: alpha/beta hydrolase [Fluviicola sp.]|nr:alpha/beta hydrolase [Fluviicola sp.]